MTLLSRIYKSSSISSSSISSSSTSRVKVLGVAEPASRDNSPTEEENEIQAQSRAKLIVSDAEEIAKKLIEDVKQQIQQQKRQAEEEIQKWWEEKERECLDIKERARTEGFETGIRDGKKVGQASAEKEYEDIIKQAHSLYHRAYEEKGRIIEEAEPFLIKLSTEIAKKIIMCELETKPDLVLGIAQHLILRAKEREALTLSVHPQDFGLVQNQRTQLVTLVNDQVDLRILPDPSVDQGGCILRTSQGSLDARIDSQLEEIKAALLGLLKDEAHE